MLPLVWGVIVIYMIPKKGGYCSLYLQILENNGVRKKKGSKFNATW